MKSMPGSSILPKKDMSLSVSVPMNKYVVSWPLRIFSLKNLQILWYPSWLFSHSMIPLGVLTVLPLTKKTASDSEWIHCYRSIIVRQVVYHVQQDAAYEGWPIDHLPSMEHSANIIQWMNKIRDYAMKMPSWRDSWRDWRISSRTTWNSR